MTEKKDQDVLFDERGWIVKDSDLPPKRTDRKKFKAKETSGMKYLKNANIKMTSPEKKPSEAPAKRKEVSKMKMDKTKRIMVIGAHPDDADLLTAGVAIKLVENGHRVKYVSVSNGNAGHHKRSAVELAFIRQHEAERSAAAIGAEYECLGVDDGHIWVNEETMRKVIKVIREFNPDLLITHRPYDYHRDHRYTGQLIMDASYMLIVPLYFPEFPPQTRDMPIICYAYDNFEKPYRFQPDVFVNVSDLIEAKTKAITNHESQLYEWLPWTNKMDDVFEEERDDDMRVKMAEMLITYHFGSITEYYLDLLTKAYPEQKSVSFEAFEICEYGRQPKRKELKELFPGAYFPKKKDIIAAMSKIK